MREISKTYGQDISDVSDTFYNAISATVDTANAIDYVKVASDMAVGGFADMNTAVGGLTASNVGMFFEDLSTAMAVLTSNGLDTAMATTAFKNAGVNIDNLLELP